MKIQHYLLLVLLILSAVWDRALYKIPNALLLTGWMIGFGFDPGPAYIARGLGTVLVLYLLAAPGFFGMGDVKLAGVMCSYLGIRATGRCLLLSLLLAAVCSIWKLIFHRELLERFGYLLAYLQAVLPGIRSGQLLPGYGRAGGKYRGPNYEGARIPYAVTICMAYVTVLVMEVMR